MHFGQRTLGGLLGDIALQVIRSTGVLFHSNVPSKSMDKSITSGRVGGGGSCEGLSIFTAWVWLGIVMMKMINKARIDISQALSEGQLRESHAQILIETREAFDLVLPGVTCHAPAERRQWKMAHQLRKHELALMHRATPRKGPRSRCARPNRCSNRDQENMGLSVTCSTS